MIVSFSVSNFRSFSTEETFSLTASNRLAGSHETHQVPIPHSSQKVLRAGVLYGANGAGKSNLFKALKFLKEVALSAKAKGSFTGREAFKLGDGTLEPTSFDLQFIAQGHLYRFGLKLNDTRILEEWLVKVRGEREEIVYERITDGDGKVTVEIPKFGLKQDKLAAMAKIGGPQNQTFLATVRANLEPEDFGEAIGAALDWFYSSLRLIAPDASFGPLGSYLQENRACAEFAGGFLKAVSTGVDHLESYKTEISEQELRSLFPDEGIAAILNDSLDESAYQLFRLGDGNELLVEEGPQKRFYRITTRAVHLTKSGEVASFHIHEESDGTRRLLNLMPALHALHTSNAVYFIDEIDRSLHPNLVREFVSVFLRAAGVNTAQLILTTHDSNLLDLDLLRRDEIWFAEKDDSSSTRLYALTDFKARKDLELRKNYLTGRFGAVPFIGDVDRLVAESTHAL